MYKKGIFLGAAVIFFSAAAFFLLHLRTGVKEDEKHVPVLPVRIEQPSIAACEPVFSLYSDYQKELSPVATVFEEQGLHFFFENDFYRLGCSGMFERLDASYDGTVYPESSWIYDSVYPIITPVCFFADALVFIDACPSLIVLDIKTGKPIRSVPSPVYPAAEAACETGVFVFRGKNGKIYEVRFTGTDNSASSKQNGNTVLFPASTKIFPRKLSGMNTDLDFQTVFAPSAEAAALIREKAALWLGSDTNIDLPAPVLLFAAEQSQTLVALPFAKGSLCLAVFSPDDQGVYTAGVCTPSGKWLEKPAFIAVFTEDGSLQSVSIDYTADKPQVKMHFSDKDVYYVVAGIFFSEDGSDEDTLIHIAVQKNL